MFSRDRRHYPITKLLDKIPSDKKRRGCFKEGCNAIQKPEKSLWDVLFETQQNTFFYID